MAAMRDVKLAFDPAGLLNPGKVLPDDLPQPVYAAPRPAPTGDAILAPAFCRGSCRDPGRLAPPKQQTRADRLSARRICTVAVAPTALLLSTHELPRRSTTFAPDDLYVTVGAGTPFAELAAFLAGHGFQAPLAAPWPDATVGGLLATNLNAPQRMRYGGWRDNVLAVQGGAARRPRDPRRAARGQECGRLRPG
ncbi:FAD-binding protein [Nostocoides sp.]